jgi:hypothetical protein
VRRHRNNGALMLQANKRAAPRSLPLARDKGGKGGKGGR